MRQIMGMLRARGIPLLAAACVAALAVALGTSLSPSLGMPAARADGVRPASDLVTTEPPAEPPAFTLMGDSHVTLMIDTLFPGAYVNGHEGTRIDDFVVYGLNGLKLSQVVSGRGTVKAGESAVGTTDVGKWRKALRTGPDTIVVNLGTNDGGPKAHDIDMFMRLAGKDRRVFWVAPYYTSCPACRAIHDFELRAAVKRHANLHLIKVRDLHLDVSSDGLHAYGRASSRALWDRITTTITPDEN